MDLFLADASQGKLSTQYAIFMATTWLENLEMSRKYTDVKEMSGISVTVREISELWGENTAMENHEKLVQKYS